MMAQLSDLAGGWLAYFAPLVLQNTVFLGGVFLALHVLRNAPARIQHSVAAVGLIKLSLPAFIPTSWFMGTAPVGSAEEISSFLFSFTGSGERLAAEQGVGWGASALVGALGLWLVMLQIRLVRAGIQTFDLVWKLKSARPVRADRVPNWPGGDGVRVLCSSRINLPLTCGLLPGRIFVPEAWADWSLSVRQAVLRHELAHLRRRDGFFQALEVFVQAVYFFHPLVWLLVSRLRELREMACDDASIEPDEGTTPLVYSRFLVEMAETILDPPLATESASTLMRRKNELLRRVSYLVKEEKMVLVSRKKLGLTLAVLVLLVLPLSMYQAVATQPPPEKTEEAAKTEKAEKAEKAKKAEQMYQEQAAQKAEQAEKTKQEKEVKAKKTSKEEYLKQEQAAEKAKKEQMLKAAKGEKVSEIQVSLKGEDVLVNGKKCGEKKFKGVLEEACGGNPEMTVVRFDCDDDVPMVKLHAAQSMMRELGMAKVSYANAEAKGIPLLLPNKEHAEKLSQLGEKDLAKLMIARDGTLVMDGKKVKADHCTKFLEKRLAENPKLIVEVDMEGGTRYGDFVKTLAMVKSAGAKRIVVNDPEI